MLRSCALGVGFVLVCVFVTTHAYSKISPDRLAAVNIEVYPNPCPVNDMVLRDLKGNPVSVASLRGSVVLLNFWKIDCPPCAQEKPLLEALHRRLSHQGLSVVAVNLFDDQNRIREYARSNGFTFTFASDPDQRLRVQTQTLPSGMPTCFVVNPKSEAIYEISMVPATYVIDRSGRIVARASGMVNWGHPDAAHYIEGLLGPQPLAKADANTPASVIPSSATSTRADSAGAVPVEHVSLPSTRTNPVKATVTDSRASGESGHVRTVANASSRLPFGGSASTVVQPDKAAPRGRATAEKQHPVSTTKSSAAKASLVKPTREPTAPATLGQVPRSAAVRPAVGRASEFNRPAGQAPGPQALGRSHEDYTAMMRQAGPSSPLSPNAGQAARPPLPPALPYAETGSQFVPSAGTTAGAQRATRTMPQPVVPDEKGYVTARVPASTERSLFGRTTTAPVAATPTARQYATPAAPPPRTEGRNPIGSFVLDSFEGSTHTRSVAPTPEQPAASRGPASVIFNPLQQLGAGIKDTISKIIPGR